MSDKPQHPSDHSWPVSPLLMDTKVEVKLNVPMSTKEGLVFPGITGTIQEDNGLSVVIMHSAVSGQPRVTEQIPKIMIVGIRKVSSILA